MIKLYCILTLTFFIIFSTKLILAQNIQPPQLTDQEKLSYINSLIQPTQSEKIYFRYQSQESYNRLLDTKIFTDEQFTYYITQPNIGTNAGQGLYMAGNPVSSAGFSPEGTIMEIRIDKGSPYIDLTDASTQEKLIEKGIIKDDIYRLNPDAVIRYNSNSDWYVIKTQKGVHFQQFQGTGLSSNYLANQYFTNQGIPSLQNNFKKAILSRKNIISETVAVDEFQKLETLKDDLGKADTANSFINKIKKNSITSLKQAESTILSQYVENFIRLKPSADQFTDFFLHSSDTGFRNQLTSNYMHSLSNDEARKIFEFTTKMDLNVTQKIMNDENLYLLNLYSLDDYLKSVDKNFHNNPDFLLDQRQSLIFYGQINSEDRLKSLLEISKQSGLDNQLPEIKKMYDEYNKLILMKEQLSTTNDIQTFIKMVGNGKGCNQYQKALKALLSNSGDHFVSLSPNIDQLKWFMKQLNPTDTFGFMFNIFDNMNNPKTLKQFILAYRNDANMPFLVDRYTKSLVKNMGVKNFLEAVDSLNDYNTRISIRSNLVRYGFATHGENYKLIFNGKDTKSQYDIELKKLENQYATYVTKNLRGEKGIIVVKRSPTRCLSQLLNTLIAASH